MIHTDWETVVSSTQNRNKSFVKVTGTDKNGNHQHVLYDIGAYISPQICTQNNRDLCYPLASTTLSNYTDVQICHICKFEGRGRKIAHVNYFMNHKVRCLSVSHGDNTQICWFKTSPKYKWIKCTDCTWMCTHHDWTCRKKFHDYYEPNGVFRVHDISEHKQTYVSYNKQNPSVMNRK